jgi:aryl-alcohol dehydrogenase-like predicted oxidoreductase
LETRKIGSLDASVVGLGTNNFGGRLDAQQTAGVVNTALDAGVTFIDTADVYGETKSEQFIGEALKSRRDEAVLATKFGVKIDDDHPGGASATYVRSATENSLRRLQTDWIDLLILHRPDPATPLVETFEALAELIAEGKVREVGCSNFSLAQLDEAEAAAAGSGARFVNLQNQYSILQRSVEAEILPACAARGIGFVPYSPLARGLLTGKFRRNEEPPVGTRIASMPSDRRKQELSDDNFSAIERLEAFAAVRGRSLLDLAFSWLLAKPGVASVIAGATSAEQISANAAAGSWKLTEDEVQAVDELAPAI